MKRLFAFIVMATLLAFAAPLLAQNTMPQPGPQGTNTNQNGPQMQTGQPSTTPQATNSSTAPAPAAAPAPSATAPATKPDSADAKKNAATAADSSSANSGATSNADAAAGTPEAPAEAPSKPAKMPHTEILETPSSGPLSADPLLQPPPMPPNKSTLIGGLAKKVDRIRNRVVVAPFGSSKTITVRFDERSHIYRDGRETTILGIHQGDRVYVDSMLIGPTVFARNLRVMTSTAPAEASGQVVAYDPRTRQVRMIDKLTGAAVLFRISDATEVTSKNGGGASDLRPGSIASVVFAPGRKGGDARQVNILAVPGTNYLFAGRVTNLDMHVGLLNLENQSDGKNYELHFNPATVENVATLRVGSQIASNATFDGRTYTAKDVTIMPEKSEAAQQ